MDSGNLRKQTGVNFLLDNLKNSVNQLYGAENKIMDTWRMGARSVKSVYVSARLCAQSVCRASVYSVKSVFDRMVTSNYCQLTACIRARIAIAVVSVAAVAVGASVADAVCVGLKVLFDPAAASVDFSTTSMGMMSLAIIVLGLMALSGPAVCFCCVIASIVAAFTE